VPSVNQLDLKTVTLKDLKDRYPVNAGGLHRDRRDATGNQPLCQTLKVAREGGKLPHRLFIDALRNRREMAPRTDVDTCRILVDVLQVLGELRALLPGRLLLLHHPDLRNRNRHGRKGELSTTALF